MWFLILFFLFFSQQCLAIAMPKDAFWVANHWRDVRSDQPSEPVNWRNLPELFISGSAAPTVENLKWVQEKIGSKYKIYIVDLRQETHVYVNGLPISIFYKKNQLNWGKSDTKIKAIEHDWTKTLLSNGKVTVNKFSTPKEGFKGPIEAITILVKDVMVESQAVENIGLSYVRIYVPDYHPPTPAQVDQFLGWIKKLPKDSWVHFHCAAGKGRTTTFMLMRDIIENAQKSSLENLAIRQAKLGGINLLAVSKNLALQPWKAESHRARMAYIHHFYNYIKSGADLHETFSEWIVKQVPDEYHAILKTAAYA
jgi:hypothetical protein